MSKEQAQKQDEKLKVDLSKLHLDDLPPPKKSTARKLSKDLVLEGGDVDGLFDESGNINMATMERQQKPEQKVGGTFKRLRQVSKKLRSMTEKAITTAQPLNPDVILNDRESEPRDIEAEVQEAQKQQRRQIFIVSGILILLALIIGLAAGLAGSSSSAQSFTSGTFPPLKSSEILLKINDVTLFGPENGTRFVVRTDASKSQDKIVAISGCNNVPINCISLTYSTHAPDFIGNCFDECQPAIIFLDPSEQNLIQIAGVQVVTGTTGLQSFGVVYFSNTSKSLTLGNQPGTDDPGVFVKLFTNETFTLKGLFGYVQEGIIVSIGFIIEELDV